jgi:hypothetical protein
LFSCSNQSQKPFAGGGLDLAAFASAAAGAALGFALVTFTSFCACFISLTRASGTSCRALRGGGLAFCICYKAASNPPR